MLLNDLFIVDDLQPGEGTVKATLRVLASHRIFDGHFPGRPVVPGACLVQLVQELVAAATGADCRLTKAGPIKFLAMIEPGRDASLSISVTIGAGADGDRQVVAEALNAGSVCFRFRGIFRAGSDYAE
jgi:3-hydroxyacyl-[acyl-carrier-protein] dehydratase